MAAKVTEGAGIGRPIVALQPATWPLLLPSIPPTHPPSIASLPTCLPRHPSKVAVLADVVKGLQALPHAAVDVDGDDLAPAGQGQGRRRGPVSGWVDEEPGEDAGWPNETLQ